MVRGGIPQDLRREPNSVDEGRQAAQNPRARVVVLFLDINHVSVDGSPGFASRSSTRSIA